MNAFIWMCRRVVDCVAYISRLLTRNSRKFAIVVEEHQLDLCEVLSNLIKIELKPKCTPNGMKALSESIVCDVFSRNVHSVWGLVSSMMHS